MEYRQKDKDGRIALSNREYKAIRAIYGAVNALAENHSELQRRCRGYKNGWRDLRCLVKLSEKVLHNVLMTVPVSKLKQMSKELDNTYCEVKTRGIVGKYDEGFMYVSEDTIINLAKAATYINCLGCDKKHGEAKRNCKLYNTLQSVFCYDFTDCEYCPFSDGV